MLNKIITALCATLSDVDGVLSSKRVITMLSFLCVMTAFLLNLFNQIPLEEFVFNGMLYLTAAGLGFTTFEKFSRKTGVNSSDLNNHHDEPLQP